MKSKFYALSFMKKNVLAFILVIGISFCLITPTDASTDITGKDSTLVVSGGLVLLIDENNTLWTWGSKASSLAFLTTSSALKTGTPQKVMDNVRSICIDRGNSIAANCFAVIKTDDSLWMWGNSSDGMIGNGKEYGPYEDQLTPVKIMDDVLDVSMSSRHVAAIKKDHSLWTWGYNGSGQLGNGIYGPENQEEHLIQNIPVKVLDGVASVSCGEGYTAAVKLDGTLWMWGDNNSNQLNNGGKGNKHIYYDFSGMEEIIGYDPGSNSGSYFQTVPVKVMDGVAAVSSGVDAPLVLRTDGTLVTWPNPRDFSETDWVLYTLLHPEVSKDSKGPFPLDRIATNVVYVEQMDNVAFIQSDGSLWIYGPNDFGQLGDGSTVSSASSHSAVKALDNVAAVSVGPNNIAAVKKDGTLWMWGFNESDILRNGGQGNFLRQGYDSTGSFFSEVCQNTPVQISDMTVKIPGEGVTSSGYAGFTDVQRTDYYADAVVWAVENGITSGTTATTFSPNTTCTTAQILTFLWRANGSPRPIGSAPSVPTGKYYSDAANWALEKGLTDVFSADSPATRALTVTYLWKLADKPAADVTAFTDVDAGAEYAQAVAWAVKEGITSGTSAATFSPDATCTRGQIVTFLYRDLAE